MPTLYVLPSSLFYFHPCWAHLRWAQNPVIYWHVIILLVGDFGLLKSISYDILRAHILLLVTLYCLIVLSAVCCLWPLISFIGAVPGPQSDFGTWLAKKVPDFWLVENSFCASWLFRGGTTIPFRLRVQPGVRNNFFLLALGVVWADCSDFLWSHTVTKGLPICT